MIVEVTRVDEIALGKEATKTDPSSEYFRSQTITCLASQVEKGKAGKSFRFRQDYRKNEAYRKSDDQPVRSADRLLLFTVEKPRRPGEKVAFWVNLTRPDVVMSPHAAYNNDCKWLGSADLILKTVRARIEKERRGAKAKQRGLIVDFTAASHELYWEFIRTADPECKPGLVKQLQTSQFPDERELAMYNLISYPGHDTIKLILPFLKDPTKETISQSSDDGGKLISREFFQLRQSAYFALLLLGARPQEPEGFSTDWHSFHADTGFESRTYFPYGDWVRVAE